MPATRIAPYQVSPTSYILPARSCKWRCTWRARHCVPGETANADLHILTPEGSAVESALGVLVFDKAVAERVRTDEEFGREYGFSVYDYAPYYYLTLAASPIATCSILIRVNLFLKDLILLPRRS